jgi:hypothetical protein
MFVSFLTVLKEWVDLRIPTCAAYSDQPSDDESHTKQRLGICVVTAVATKDMQNYLIRHWTVFAIGRPLTVPYEKKRVFFSDSYRVIILGNMSSNIWCHQVSQDKTIVFTVKVFQIL